MSDYEKYAGQHDKTRLGEMFLTMNIIRCFEENVKYLYQKNLCYGGMHLCVGEEACAVGSCFALRKDDKIVTSHRGHGHCIAKGVSVRRMVAELMAKKEGLCKGRGGSMHILDMSCGVLGAQGIVGAQIPIAVGAALSAKIRGLDYVSAAFFGDGASNIGYFHEGVNMAAALNLPVIFICSNNGYAVSTSYKKFVKSESIASRGEAYGIEGIQADGNNVLEVYDVVKKAADKARSGGGPTLIELITYRWYGHYVGDPCDYRTREEENWWKSNKDPIKNFGDFLVNNKTFSKDELNEMEEKAKAVIDDANAYALQCPDPSIEEMYEDLYYLKK